MSDRSLVCRIGSQLAAIPLEYVVETMRPLAIEPLAGLPPFVLGLSIVRGVPVPVVDLASILTGASQQVATRFVTIRVGGRVAMIPVAAVVAIAAPGALEDLPPLVSSAPTDLIAAVGTADADLLVVLRAARIVPESVWAAFDAAVNAA